MMEEGILAPAKVTRLALENATWVSGLLLTESWLRKRRRTKSIHTAVRRRSGRMGEMDM
jgi:chaperonin GroEL (HSP60 family)